MNLKHIDEAIGALQKLKEEMLSEGAAQAELELLKGDWLRGAHVRLRLRGPVAYGYDECSPEYILYDLPDNQFLRDIKKDLILEGEQSQFYNFKKSIRLTTKTYTTHNYYFASDLPYFNPSIGTSNSSLLSAFIEKYQLKLKCSAREYDYYATMITYGTV